MTDRDDDSFRPKLAPPRSKGSTRFITRVIKAASQSGVLARGKISPGRARPGARLGRGLVAARMASQRVNGRSRRVTIKMRMVNLTQAGKRSTPTHLRYLERDGVSQDGERGQAYGPNFDDVDVKEFERRGQRDRHQFRFIVSAEDGTEIQDLKSFTRDLMTQMERDLGTRLEWVAVDHWDTEHPHTHVVLRGKDQTGRDLIIAREYIVNGMRARARELATEWLGPRTQREIDASAEREVTQERWTGLDGAIQRDLRDGVIDIGTLSGGDRSVRQRAAVIGRLNHLSIMGLAEKTQPGVWRVSREAPEVLRALGERGDIIRTLQRALGTRQQGYQIFDAARTPPVTGRVIAKGLHDELSDRGYLIVDGLDGRAHYAALAVDIDLSSISKGAIVEVRGAEPRAADRAIAATARQGIYRSEDHLRQLRADGKTRDPESVVQAHGRRLEALRRGRLVERLSEGVWKIPEHLPDRGRAYDLKRLGGATIDIRCHLPLEQQTRAMGATWLDQQLIKGTTQWPSTDLGTTVRQALLDRQDFLVDQDLARRISSRVILAQNLLSTLREREVAETAARIEATSHLRHRPTMEGVRVSGTYRESIQLTSGRYALLDDGVGFSLVPWRPVIEKRLGQEVSAVIDGARVNWEFGRSRSLSL